MLKPFLNARTTLGVSLTDDASEIKRAYRRAVAEHPPDRDPDGFRRIREAYELLSAPLKRAESMFFTREPSTAPLDLGLEPPRRGSLVEQMVRLAIARLDFDVEETDGHK